MTRTLPLCLLFAALAAAQSVTVPPFPAESREFFTTAQGLPSNDIRSIAVTPSGAIYAATPAGLARLDNNRWTVSAPEPAFHAAATGDTVFYTTATALHRLGQGQIAALNQPEALAAQPGRIWAAAAGKIIEIAGSQVREYPSPGPVRQIALSPSGRTVVATQNGVFERENGAWTRIFAGDWSLNDARAATFDAQNTLWIAAAAGVAHQTADGQWRTFTGRNGLPHNDFTFAAATREPWFTTRLGAIRFDGHDFRYRQGLRYLPSDDVRAVALAPNGDAWFATAAGVGVIRRKTVTLAEKARYFEDEIDNYHRRTPFEYILEVALAAPGDKSKFTRHDSDNDGLWTAMYGAGECFAWAATKDPKARARATKAFEALRFLGTVTQGGPNPAPPGFVARTILPTSGPDPNAAHYTPERDAERRRTVDSKWKIISPRWPRSADGQWFWKSDTSSDELDGHYFLNGLYYDLVAESAEEKQRVRDQVTAMTDHLISHGFKYIDHDGQPTRWGYFDPESLNFDSTWFEERGLNSLSMLTYLRVAHHITGHDRYQQAFQRLVREHGYATNLMVPKIQSGPGAGNQSDDEMAFMNYYHLLKYEKDPRIRQMVALSLHRYWQLEAPEMNPFFNFVAAFALKGATYTDAYGTNPMDLPGVEWLDDSVETLRRIPLDRVNWSYRNSHRLDITPLEDHKRENGGKGAGHRSNGKVIPYDEQFVQHWNHDPWRLDFNGQGRTLATGAVYLLPYYMGLYHGFIRE